MFYVKCHYCNEVFPCYEKHPKYRDTRGNKYCSEFCATLATSNELPEKVNGYGG